LSDLLSSKERERERERERDRETERQRDRETETERIMCFNSWLKTFYFLFFILDLLSLLYKL